MLGHWTPLQTMILDILLRIRIKPVILAGDIRQAFLQIVIRETERDALRFIWVDNISNKNPVILEQLEHSLGYDQAHSSWGEPCKNT